MKLSTVEKVIEVHGTGRRRNYSWYNWGEPLLHKQFHEFIDIAKHVRTTISSNFSLLLTDKYFESLAKIEQVVISMSGLTSDVYNIYHRGGDFEQVAYNLKRVAELPNIKRMNWLRHAGNVHQEQQAKDFCEEHGIVWGGLNGNCEVEELVEGFTHPMLKTPRQYSGRKMEKCRLKRWIPISVDGEYLLCCTTHNVKTGLTIWDNVSSEELIEAKSNLHICKICGWRELWRMF